MGKVRIVGGGEDGLYSVEVLYNRERIDAEIEYLETLIAEIIARRDELQADYDEAVLERSAAAVAVDEKVAAYVAAGSVGVLNLEVELVALANASAKVQSIDVSLTMVKGRLLQAQKRKDALDAIPKEQIQPAWCADLTTDLAGDVRSVEVPDEGRQNLLIYPAHFGGQVYDPMRDGQLFHREGQVGYQVYFNAAILPGVQRWHPQFRLATLESVDKDADTASIAYESMDSSAQSLLITDPDAKRTEVPIHYMECNSAVFEVGDKVLVELQNRDWQQPRIIGFRDNPRGCSIIMAYQLGHFYEGGTYTDFVAPTGAYPARPADYFRDNGITTVTVSLWREGGLALLFDRNLDQVLSAELISEMPDFSAFDFLGLPAIDKGSFAIPTSEISRFNLGPQQVPVIGTTQSPSGGVYPISRPPSPFTLTPTSLEVVCREYWAQNFQYYSYDSLNRVNWSPQVDVAQLAGEVTVTCTLDDFPPEIQWKGTTFHRKHFVNYVPFDFDNDRGADATWWLDRICISYAPE